MIMRRVVAAFCASLLMGSGVQAAPKVPATPKEIGDLPLNYTPPPDSDEAGLWMMSEQLEKGMRASPLLVRDPALNAYVKRVVCHVAPDRCDSIRIYILDIPYFNAAMSPNGAMQVWTGLLLRCTNEAQLAYILGHETSHYTLRHTIEMWRRVRSSSGSLMVFTLLTAGLGALAAIGMMHSLLAHSRDEEREADARGFALASAGGYDPSQSVAVWRSRTAEDKVTPKKDDIFAFTATHPAPDERLAKMEQAAEVIQNSRTDWTVGTTEYRSVVDALRDRWLEEDLALAHYDASLLVLNDLIAQEPDSGLLRFYRGEVYRRRNLDSDPQKAIEAYRAALTTKDAPATTYRGLGLTQMKAGDKEDARDSFQKYLAAAPNASDRTMVEYYISHL